MGYWIKGRAKKSYSILIITIMLLGVVAAAFAYFGFLQRSPCEDPNYQPNPVLSEVYLVAYNNIIFNAINATFSRYGQVVVIGDVTFRNLVQIDSSSLRLVGQTCVIDNSQPFSLVLEAAFQSDGFAELLSVQYGGSVSSEPAFTSHTSWQAGVNWYPGDTHLVLMATP